MRKAILLFLGICLAGCASTPDQKLSSLESINPQTVVAIKSENIDKAALMTKAQSLYKTGSYANSRHAYQTVLLHHPDDEAALLGLGNAAFALNDIPQAFDAFMRIDPEKLTHDQKENLLAGLALLRLGAQDNNDTEGHIRRATQYVPNDPRLWNALGRYYDQKQMWVDSTESYVKALETGKAKASVINNLGMSLMMQGRYEEASDKFEQAASLEPETELYDNNRRLILALHGQYEDAVSGLNASRAALLYNDGGYIAMIQGHEDIAYDLITRSIDINPVYDAKAAANLQYLKTAKLRTP